MNYFRYLDLKLSLFIGTVMLLSACGQEPAPEGMMTCDAIRLSIEELGEAKKAVDRSQETVNLTFAQTQKTVTPSTAELERFEGVANRLLSVFKDQSNRGECAMPGYKTSISLPQRPAIVRDLDQYRSQVKAWKAEIETVELEAFNEFRREIPTLCNDVSGLCL